MNTPSKDKAVGSMIAAAVGDAIGWPYEGRSRRLQAAKFSLNDPFPSRFSGWIRSGARSEPYREPIKPGEYSDDTQLLLATARSLLHCDNWQKRFALVELPSWLLYERGGGGATKRAAQSWLAGTAPWESPRFRDQFFEAGGNGVCMRILPHILAHRESEVPLISQDIVANGLMTHGHPRALIGALLHGLVLWLASMAASILAGVNGGEWLGDFAKAVQDSNYIRKLACDLVTTQNHRAANGVERVTKKDNDMCLANLKKLREGDKIKLPDGRSGKLFQVEEMFSQTAKAYLCRVELEDGQTLALKNIQRGAKRTDKIDQVSERESESIVRVGIKLFVPDLTKARQFYVQTLHLPIDKAYQSGFTVAGIISILLADGNKQSQLRFSDFPIHAILCIRVAKLSIITDRLSEAGIPISYVNGSHSYKAIRIVDPFGNTLELFEA
jgi:ADP-ribosylglycohydrolase